MKTEDKFDLVCTLRERAATALREAQELEVQVYQEWAAAEYDRPIHFAAIINLPNGNEVTLDEHRGLYSFLKWVLSAYPEATSVVISLAL